MSSVVVVGDVDTVVGFRLAGVRACHVHNDVAETERYIRETLQADVGVIIITERAAAEVRETVDRLRSEKGRVKPIFVEVPDKRGPTGVEDHLQKLVRRVVGVEVTLEAR